jgi:hypothetical protein
MQVKCITIEGENAIISAAEFDWLMAQAAKVEKLEKVAAAAWDVAAWDWSDNDAEPARDMAILERALNAL